MKSQGRYVKEIDHVHVGTLRDFVSIWFKDGTYLTIEGPIHLNSD